MMISQTKTSTLKLKVTIVMRNKISNKEQIDFQPNISATMEILNNSGKITI